MKCTNVEYERNEQYGNRYIIEFKHNGFTYYKFFSAYPTPDRLKELINSVIQDTKQKA